MVVALEKNQVLECFRYQVLTMQTAYLTELQESEARFRSMFEHSAVGIGIIGLDPQYLPTPPKGLAQTEDSPAQRGCER